MFKVDLYGVAVLNRFRRLLVLLVCCFLLSCDSAQKVDGSVVRVGIIPDGSIELMEQKYKPLFDYMTEETGYQYELYTPDTYQDLVELFEQHKVDLAIFGGYLFLKVKESRGAKPLVLRDVDEKFRSIVVVNSRHEAANLGDTHGLSFAFGSKLSTAGHLMPRFYFLRNEINPESFFQKITYSGSHSRTVKLVEEGRVDAGVANAITVRRMLASGEVDQTKLRIVWESPPYTDYVWAVQKTMSDKKMNRIRDSFLSLDPGVAQHKTILSKLGAGYFMPAGQGAFSELSRIANSLGLLE